MQDTFFGVNIKKKKIKGKQVACFSGYDAAKWLSAKFGTQDKKVVVAMGQELINMHVIISLQKENIFKPKIEHYYQFYKETETEKKTAKVDFNQPNTRLSISLVK